MTNAKDTGGIEVRVSKELSAIGMTLRDYFAGQVLAGVDSTETTIPVLDLTVWAYEVATAMIEARK